MGLVACKCPQCGADLEFDESRDTMFCQYCGSKILKTNVIQNVTNNITNNIRADNVNVSGQLDVDTMFYNWLVGQNQKLKNDLSYYYAGDDRANFSELVGALSYVQRDTTFLHHDKVTYENYKKALQIAYKLSDNPKYKPYIDEYIKALREAISLPDKVEKKEEEARAAREALEAKQKEKTVITGVIIWLVLTIAVILFFIFVNNV